MTKPKQYKLVLVNPITKEKRDSVLKGAGILSKREAAFIVRHHGPKLIAPWIYETARIQ